MSLRAGQALGPYEIISPIGAGGMGEVYKARDSRLERSVALKILPPALAGDPQLRARFEREARTISQINHPNICTIHDVGESDGTNFLVMELLEGETLAARIQRGRLSPREVLTIGAQIATGLAAAHKLGVVHRDLKPGNIMLTRGGAKLLDFGLAKNVGLEVVSAESPTVQISGSGEPLTGRGTILGTFQYMSPEQIEGDEVDTRTDIFALGCVLYEMVTGTRPFDGKTRTSLIAAIVASEPRPLRELEPVTPPALERVILRCIAKDPDERWQSAADLAAELKWILEQLDEPESLASRRRGWSLSITLILLAVSLATAAWLLLHDRDQPSRGRLALAIAPPTDAGFLFTGEHGASLSISPDGKRVTFSVADENGASRLWLRSLTEGTAAPIAGTEEGTYPFWSPDGQSIGFFAHGRLKTVPADGGPVFTVCDAVEGRGGSWGPDGTILLAPDWRGPIFRVPASGGTPIEVTKLRSEDGETTHRWPQFLPDGKHFIFLAASHTGGSDNSVDGLYVADLQGGQPKLLTHARSNGIITGASLIYFRDDFLVSQRFDHDRLALEGPVTAIAGDVRYESSYFTTVAAAAEDILIFQRGESLSASSPQWFSQTGERQEQLTAPIELYELRISPDGRTLISVESDTSDLWLHDLERQVKSRLTGDPLNDFAPVWAPDSQTVYFTSDRRGTLDIFRKSVAGGTEEAILTDAQMDEVPSDLSRSGTVLLFDFGRIEGTRDVDIRYLDLSARSPSPKPLRASPAREFDGRLSPDGRWVAYVSDESGRTEIYVTPFPEGERAYQVTGTGAMGPRWSADGDQIFFVQTDGTLAHVSFRSSGARPLIGAPVPVLNTRIKSQFGIAFYDVAPDGRIIVNELPVEKDLEPLTVLLNWEN